MQSFVLYDKVGDRKPALIIPFLDLKDVQVSYDHIAIRISYFGRQNFKKIEKVILLCFDTRKNFKKWAKVVPGIIKNETHKEVMVLGEEKNIGYYILEKRPDIELILNTDIVDTLENSAELILSSRGQTIDSVKQTFYESLKRIDRELGEGNVE